MNLRTVAGWAAVAFIVWWVIETPTNASHLVHNLGAFFMAATNGLSHFFTSI